MLPGRPTCHVRLGANHAGPGRPHDEGAAQARHDARARSARDRLISCGAGPKYQASGRPTGSGPNGKLYFAAWMVQRVTLD